MQYEMEWKYKLVRRKRFPNLYSWRFVNHCPFTKTDSTSFDRKKPAMISTAFLGPIEYSRPLAMVRKSTFQNPLHSGGVETLSKRHSQDHYLSAFADRIGGPMGFDGEALYYSAASY